MYVYSDGARKPARCEFAVVANAVNPLGPAGGGKSSLLRTRPFEQILRVELCRDNLLNEQIYSIQKRCDRMSPESGIVFSRPIPLPLSIYENVSMGCAWRVYSARKLDEAVEWD